MIPILVLAEFLAQAVSAPPPVITRVEGSVINSLNGEPVRKATVVLHSRDADHGLSYADETDSNGHFSIPDLEPGEYAITAEHADFFLRSSGATGAPPPNVKVEAGQQIKDFKIRLTPLGVITGRVLDSDGDPVRSAIVNALRYAYSSGKKQLRMVDQVQTGDNGEFRLFGLRPGTLYLRATHQRWDRHAKDVTYYPGTSDENHAAPIQLRAGAQLEGFDIRLQSGNSYSVRLEFPEGHPPPGGLNGFLVNDQGGFAGRSVNFSQTDIVFPGIAPGSYEAVLNVLNEDKPVVAIAHVEVVNADVDGGTLTFLPLVETGGSVRVEGGAFSQFEKLRIDFESRYRVPMLNASRADVKPNGSFQFKNAVPGVYEIGINRVPGVYLKSVRMGDKQLADRRVDLAAKTDPIIIVLGADVGQVEGSVHNAKGEPVVRARVTVIPYGDHSGRIDLSRTGFSDDKGEFKIKDVAPGDYKAFAWEDVPVGAPQDPDFRKPFERQGVSVRMQPNGHEKIALTSIPAAATNGDDQ
jgi:Carboxypeptidase regulatory-like domain